MSVNMKLPDGANESFERLRPFEETTALEAAPDIDAILAHNIVYEQKPRKATEPCENPKESPVHVRLPGARR